jgi:hypothetical protein
VLGDLVQTTNGQWITQPPSRCPHGHTLGPGQVLVGHQACLGHGGGRTTWTCRTCDATVYGPPLNTPLHDAGRPCNRVDLNQTGLIRPVRLRRLCRQTEGERVRGRLIQQVRSAGGPTAAHLGGTGRLRDREHIIAQFLEGLRWFLSACECCHLIGDAVK